MYICPFSHPFSTYERETYWGWGSRAEQNPRVLPLHPLPGTWASMSVCLSALRIPLRGWWRPAQPCSGDRVWRGGRPEVLVSSTWD